MRIVVPSYQRPSRCETLSWLTLGGITPDLVIQPQEQAAYAFGMASKYNCNLVILPPEVKGIANTRQWIVDNTEDDKLLMLDDDLKFFRRVTPTDWHLNKCNAQDMVDMIAWVDDNLNRYPSVGVSLRQGNNQCPSSTRTNGQLIRAVGVHLPTLRQHGLRYDVLPVMEDRHVCLSLLDLGYENCINFEFANDQASSQSAGGCTEERTKEIQDSASRRLAELHPGIVKVVQKETKNGWWGGTRTDTVVQWKQAYKNAKVKRTI
jgi:hypothetical protein